MKKKVNLVQSEEGFTLIEVIAVLIIMGILAAVAVPKYFDLATEAEKKTWDAAFTEAKGIVTLAYGKASIIHSREPSTAEIATVLGTEKFLGDFKCLYDEVTNVGFDITLQLADGTTINGADGNPIPTQRWELPK